MCFHDSPRTFFPMTGILVLGLAFPSCSHQSSVEPEAASKDDQLIATIVEALGEQGHQNLRMPHPEDFSSIPQDANNPLTAEKVSLGRLLFHETGLGGQAIEESGMGTFSCASCHHATAGFQAGIQQGLGDGGTGFGFRGEGRTLSDQYAPEDVDRQPMRSPTAMNGAFSTVMLWNGQFGAGGANEGTQAQWTPGTPIEVNHLGYSGLETQAIAGLTVHRMAPDAAFFDAYPGYASLFDAAFPDVPTRDRYSVETAGLAIAAYERTIMGYEAPFQQWLRGERTALSESQKNGAMVFFGDAQCGTCHQGPALTDGAFHALGMPDMSQTKSSVVRARNYGQSEATLALGRGGFTGDEEDYYAFKTPQLYNLKDSPFYGHGGTFRSLEEVVRYKVEAKAANPEVEGYLSSNFQPLELTDQQQSDLLDFLTSGLYDPHLDRYVPSGVMSRNCIPNSDPQSSVDLGCEPG